MIEQVRSLAPSVRQRTVGWLRDHDVSVSWIAGAFCLPTSTVRSDHFRYLRRVSSRYAFTKLFTRPIRAAWSPQQTHLLKSYFRLREEPYIAARSGSRKARLQFISDAIGQIVAAALQDKQYLAAVRRLRRLREEFGNFSDVRLLRLRAELEFRIAYFIVHTGRAHTAIRTALNAMVLARLAADEAPASDFRHNMSILAESGLVAAIGYLLQQNSAAALEMLGIVNDASWAARSLRTRIDLHHQLGTVYFQKGSYDELARKHFFLATRWQEHLGDFQDISDLAITGARKINFLDKNWDGSGGQQEIVIMLSRRYQLGSLQDLMMRNWAAACGLSLDKSSRAQKDALELLIPSSLESEWGHQMTTAKLLTITPELPLSTVLRSKWIRFALYENALHQD